MARQLSTFWTDESGQDMAEYAILLALIAIVVILAINTLAPAIGNSFNNTSSAIANSGAGSGGGGGGGGGGSGTCCD